MAFKCFKKLTFLMCVCEDKFEFENPRRNPLILAAPHLEHGMECMQTR